MSKIKSIGGTYTPAEIANKVPWGKIKSCMVIYHDEENDCVYVHCSTMEWKRRAWLTHELQAQTLADRVVVMIDREDK